MSTNYFNYEYKTGYIEFTGDVNFDFQLNRFLSFEAARKEDFIEILHEIETFEDWEEAMVKLAKKAEKEERLIHAAIYYRAAEFFSFPFSEERSDYYRKFVELFSKTIKIEMENIPYDNGFLPAYKLIRDDAKANVLVHGGFDSFIQELYPIVAYIHNEGYNVYIFEGPGQGGALIEHQLTLTPKWEKPVAAVLDYFELEEVCLVGISFGGYLGLRASAFESRIKQFIAYDIFYDAFENFLSKQPIIKRIISNLMISARLKRLFNYIIKRRTQTDTYLKWLSMQGQYITGTQSPFEYFSSLKQYSSKNIGEKLTQDVLLLAGEEDHAIPIQFLYKTIKVLSNAKSLTARIFTKKENASQHCQVGNMKLVLETIVNWMDMHTHSNT